MKAISEILQSGMLYVSGYSTVVLVLFLALAAVAVIYWSVVDKRDDGRLRKIAESIMGDAIKIRVEYSRRLVDTIESISSIEGIEYDSGNVRFAVTASTDDRASIERAIVTIRGIKRELSGIRKELNLNKSLIKTEFSRIAPELPALGTGRWGVKAERSALQSIWKECLHHRDEVLHKYSEVILMISSLLDQADTGIQQLKLA